MLAAGAGLGTVGLIAGLVVGVYLGIPAISPVSELAHRYGGLILGASLSLGPIGFLLGMAIANTIWTVNEIAWSGFAKPLPADRDAIDS